MNMMFNILGKRLAEIIERDELVCRGLLRYAISDSVAHLGPTTDYQTWEKHLNAMSFRDWEALLQEGPLARHLVNVGIKNSANVDSQLRQTLIEKQSLLTMAVH